MYNIFIYNYIVGITGKPVKLCRMRPMISYTAIAYQLYILRNPAECFNGQMIVT
ncbi:MAG: hypothetical protein V6D39_07775 [Dolichospermum lemmermannii FEM_B0920]